MKCFNCGKEFKRRNAVSKYCSPECAKEFYKKKYWENRELNKTESILEIKRLCNELDDAFFKSAVLRKEIEVTLRAEGYYDRQAV